jgi:hypothetical protein
VNARLVPPLARQLTCTQTKAMWVGLNLSLNEQSGQESWARQCSYVLAFSCNDEVKPHLKSYRVYHKLKKYILLSVTSQDISFTDF